MKINSLCSFTKIFPGLTFARRFAVSIKFEQRLSDKPFFIIKHDRLKTVARCHFYMKIFIE